MGGTESFVDTYIKQHGIQGLSKLVLLKKKISWLEESCNRQFDRKIDDEIKYILFQIDQLVNQKKQIITQSFKQYKTRLVQSSPKQVRKMEQQNGRLLQNIYGRNLILDQLNSIKIEFHIQVHLNKKKIKKSIEQKIANIENKLLYQTTDVPISKHTIDNIFQQEKKKFDLVMDDPEFKRNLEEFKNQTIMDVNFDNVFWPSFDRKIRQTELQIENAFIEAGVNLKKMKTDIRNY